MGGEVYVLINIIWNISSLPYLYSFYYLSIFKFPIKEEKINILFQYYSVLYMLCVIEA